MRTPRLNLASLLVLTTSLTVAACGAPVDPNEHPGGTGDAGADGSPFADTGAPDTAPAPPPPLDSGVGDVGSDADAGCKPTDSVDDPDEDGVDLNCDGADGTVGRDVYVEPTAGLASNPGTPSKPLATIEDALKLATSRNGRVLVASGTYKVKDFSFSGSWRVIGGYDASFRGPSKGDTILSVPSTGLLVANATKASLERLTVLGDSPGEAVGDAPAPPTAVAIRTRADELVLDHAKVRAGDGRSGVDGAPGAAGEDGKRIGWTASDKYGAVPYVCDGVAVPTYAVGASDGTPNAEGKPAGVSASNTAAGEGSAGNPGVDGKDSSRLPQLVDGVLLWPLGSAGLGNGTPGYGGAGGARPAGFFGGWGGNGGCPGKGGAAGQSGGGSVAVMVLAGKVTVVASELRTGIGGNGGSGGDGGAGGAGAVGGAPSDKPTETCTPKDGPTATSPKTGCATFGGHGGAGGRGGHGGAGAGGWTFGIVTAPKASADIDGATKYVLGAPGIGGVGGGGSSGPAGEKRMAYALP